MISIEERDALFDTISDLRLMNRIMNNQAKKIQNKEGLFWGMLSDDERENRTNEYDQMIEQNNRIIDACINKVMKEFGIKI